jgi:hypothetical protein
MRDVSELVNQKFNEKIRGRLLNGHIFKNSVLSSLIINHVHTTIFEHLNENLSTNIIVNYINQEN